MAASHDTEVELFSVAGRDGHLREVNEPFARLLGLTPAEVDGRSILELVHPDDIAPVVAGLAALDRGGSQVLLESRFAQRDGRWVHLQWVARPVPGTDLWWAAGRDTTEFHRLLAERTNLRTQLDLALGQATAAMWELDFATGTFTWEPQAAQILDVLEAAVPAGVPQLAAAVDRADSDAVVAAFEEMLTSGVCEVGVRVGEGGGLRYLSLRGKVLDRDRRGRALCAMGLLLDVTTEKAMEEQMLRMVMLDALTGAPNRRAFDQALRAEWRRATRALEPLSVLMVDIDNFKGFNDSFGHLVGDEALCAVARALAGVVHREGDVVTRFGGEEFAVVLPGIDAAGALAVATGMVEAVRAVALRQAPGRALSVSVGSATCHPEEPALKAAALLGRADQALYAAKQAGKDRVVAYEGSLAARDALEAAIGLGLKAGEFELYYQPVIALSTGAPVGVEALMRWNRPADGLVQPDQFIPVAAQSALICDLDEWALRQAAGQLAAWHRAGLDPHRSLRVAVNVSGRHASSPAIVTDVRAALATSGIRAAQLEIEVTESALADGDFTDTHLAQIRALGVNVAIDDFGTGRTSIRQIPHLPADSLKIDRSLFASLDTSQQSLVALMVGAAHSFGLRVIAEGIEDSSTLQSLRELGCDNAQGFLFAKPMTAAHIPGWLAHWNQGQSSLFSAPKVYVSAGHA